MSNPSYLEMSSLNCSLVIDVLAVATIRIPVSPETAAMSDEQLRSYAAKVLADADHDEMCSSIEEISPIPDQISIENLPLNEAWRTCHVSLAYKAFMETEAKYPRKRPEMP